MGAESFNNRSWVITFVGMPVFGFGSIFASKVLDNLGWLDPPAEALADFLNANIGGADFSAWAGFLLSGALYGLLLRGAWKTPRHERGLSRSPQVDLRHDRSIRDMLKRAIDGIPVFDVSPKPNPQPKRKASQIARDQIDEMTQMAPAIEGARSEAPFKSKPRPDMNLTELLVRVYKHLGGAPKEQPERDNFIRKVDFEIIDQITENGLHVWGRYGDRAREPISAHSLRQGKLNHRMDTFAVPSIDSGPMVFRELRFDRDEVDQVWPKK